MSIPVSPHSGRVHWPALLGVAVLAAMCALILTSPAGARRAPQASAPAIAFIKGDHVWRVAPDGTGLKRLTSGKSEDSAPAWSPDHATVAFVRPGSSYKRSSIYTVPAAGGDARLLYKDSIPKTSFLDVTGLAYSPDGTKLAFADISSAKGSPPINARLVILDIQSGLTSVMLKKTGGFGHILVTSWHLSWSPDGSAILISQQGQDDEGNGTWVYTIISGATKAVPVRNASWSDWAKDGTAVLLSTSIPTKTSIKQVKLDGTDVHTLATGGGWDGPGAASVYTADYSPDGSQVVFLRSGSLWIMDADGTGKHKVTAGFTPAW